MKLSVFAEVTEMPYPWLGGVEGGDQEMSAIPGPTSLTTKFVGGSLPMYKQLAVAKT